MYYFLKPDFDALSAEIEKIADTIKAIGQEMGKSCQEGAETFHDNFAYEDGERQQLMWSTRLRELIRMRNQAHIARPEQTDIVSIGRRVTFSENGEVRTVKIGSYMVLNEEEKQAGAISYNAPLARLLLKGKAGDTKEGTISGKKKSLEIIRIE